MPQAVINPQRLNHSLQELGRIGDTPQGMQRLAFTPSDVAGREYAMTLMRRAGMEVRIDAGGNIVARKSGTDPNLPAIAMGSHLDTVPNGGKYDGALGVMGASKSCRLWRTPTSPCGTRWRSWCSPTKRAPAFTAGCSGAG